MNLFELFVKIGVDDQASGKLKDLSGSLGNGLRTAAKIGTAAIGAVSAAVVGLGKIGVSYNSQMESYTTNFTTMLGSASAAAKKVDELKKFAAKTPFEMSDLAAATQTLLSFGIDSEKTGDIMKMLGDVSLGNSQKFSSLALVFGQVSSQGKLMGQDLLQMINAGFNPLQVISEKTGESMESLKERMSAGEIGIAEVTQAFQWATSEGGKFYNGMEAGSKTFSGLVSTLKDNATALIGEVFQPISDKLSKSVLPAAINAIEHLTETFRNKGIDGMIEAGGSIVGQLVSTIAKKIPDIAKGAAKMLKAIVGELVSKRNLRELAGAAIDIVKVLAKTIVDMSFVLVEAAGDLVDALGEELAERIPALSGVFRGLGDAIKAAAVAFAAFKAAMGIASLIQGVTKTMAGLNGVMSANPIMLVVGAIGLLVTALGTAKSKVKDLADAQKDLNDARSDFITAEKEYTEAIKAVERAEQNLADTESEVGESHENIVRWVQEGRIAYSELSEAGRKLYDAYLDLKEAQSRVEQSSKDVAEAKRNEINASFDEREALAKESGKWHEYRDAVVDAFKRGELSSDEARERISRAMGEIGSLSWVTFGEDLPESIKEGLNPMKYSSEMYRFKVFWRDALQSIGKWFSDLWGWITGGSKAATDAAFERAVNSVNPNAVRAYTVAPSNAVGRSGGVSVVQNIYSEAKTAADLMQEALYQQERAVLFGVHSEF